MLSACSEQVRSNRPLIHSALIETCIKTQEELYHMADCRPLQLNGLVLM